MKVNKNWQVFFITGTLMSALLVGCETQNEAIRPSTSPTSIVENIVSESSIYNTSYENYSNITDLGIIVNSPSEEDLGHLSTLDSYVFQESAKESMLIIPKYNGSKITVSKVEYTGERYIPKETLYTKEATTEGYGLLVKANYPEGIPELIITVSYQNKSCEYLVIYDGKNGNEEVKYLKVGEEDKKKEGDLITPIQDPTYLQDLNRFSSYEVDVDKDGNNEIIEVYCQGELSPEGEYLMDDGQQWTLILRKGNEIYPLFEKSYIQLGGLEYTVYVDYDDYESIHIIVAYKSSAAIIYYDCTYDEDSGNMLRTPIYESNNISKLKDWK